MSIIPMSESEDKKMTIAYYQLSIDIKQFILFT